MKHKTLACISDMLQHDMHTVYSFQKTITLNVVKKGLLQINISVMAAVESIKTTKMSLIVYITIATMHGMQNGISLQEPTVIMHVTYWWDN